MVAPCIIPLQYGIAPHHRPRVSCIMLYVHVPCMFSSLGVASIWRHPPYLPLPPLHSTKYDEDCGSGSGVGTRSSKYEIDALDHDHKYETEHGYEHEHENSNRSPEIGNTSSLTVVQDFCIYYFISGIY